MRACICKPVCRFMRGNVRVYTLSMHASFAVSIFEIDNWLSIVRSININPQHRTQHLNGTVYTLAELRIHYSRIPLI